MAQDGGDEMAVAIEVARDEVRDLVKDDPEDLGPRSTERSRQKPASRLARSRSDGGGDEGQPPLSRSQPPRKVCATL